MFVIGEVVGEGRWAVGWWWWWYSKDMVLARLKLQESEAVIREYHASRGSPPLTLRRLILPSPLCVRRGCRRFAKLVYLLNIFDYNYTSPRAAEARTLTASAGTTAARRSPRATG